MRGVIAAESATNAREGGALVPTVAFGVPASAGMAILLGAFLIHGLVPGPDMLTKHLDLTYSMVWSIAIANILGSGLCFAFSGQLAKLATLRYTLIMPGVLSLIYIGAFEATRNWGDLLLAAVLRHARLGDEAFPMAAAAARARLHSRRADRALYVHLDRALRRRLDAASRSFSSCSAWLRSLLGPLLQDIRSRAPQMAVAETHVPYTGRLVSFWHGLKRTWSGLKVMVTNFGTPRFATDNLFPAALLILFVVMLSQSFDWAFAARIVPTIVGIGAILFCSLSLVNEIFGVHERNAATATAGAEPDSKAPRNSHGHRVEDRASARRYGVGPRLSVLSAGWPAFMLLMWIIGLIPAVPIFIISYMRLEGRENMADRHSDGGLRRGPDLRRVRPLLAIPWPPTLLGTFFPILKVIPSV